MVLKALEYYKMIEGAIECSKDYLILFSTQK